MCFMEKQCMGLTSLNCVCVAGRLQETEPPASRTACQPQTTLLNPAAVSWFHWQKEFHGAERNKTRFKLNTYVQF